MSENDKIDWGKASEMEEALNAAEAERLARVRIFDPKEIVRKAKEVREIVDEDLGTIRYVLLNYDELNEIIEKCKDNRDRSIQLLFKQLEPVNEGLKVEDIRKMPYEVVVRLLTKLQMEGSFFQRPQTPSPNGSQTTEERRPSDSSRMSTVTHFK
ncbi:MAG: hypothetical protein ABSD73_08190 [Candidatus Bathyarchaeia archaeon]